MKNKNLKSSVHEAGHFIIARHYRIRLYDVMLLRQKNKGLSAFTTIKSITLPNYNTALYKKYVYFFMAGIVADKITNPKIKINSYSVRYKKDILEATYHAASYLYSMDIEPVSIKMTSRLLRMGERNVAVLLQMKRKMLMSSAKTIWMHKRPFRKLTQIRNGSCPLQ